jgi:hypothetical protein
MPLLSSISDQHVTLSDGRIVYHKTHPKTLTLSPNCLIKYAHYEYHDERLFMTVGLDIQID